MVKFISTALSIFSSIQSNMDTLKWRMVLLGAALILIGCQGQTFQYSRGWTNGKRAPSSLSYTVPRSSSLTTNNNGGAQQNPVIDVDSGLVSVASIEDPPSQMGTFRILNSDGSLLQGSGFRIRDREARDTTQFGKKLGTGINSNNNRKPPFWIVGVDPENTIEF